MATARDSDADIDVCEGFEAGLEDGFVDLGRRVLVVNDCAADWGWEEYLEAKDLWLDEVEGFAVHFDEAFA